jgi:hypothetical protein
VEQISDVVPEPHNFSCYGRSGIKYIFYFRTINVTGKGVGAEAMAASK